VNPVSASHAPYPPPPYFDRPPYRASYRHHEPPFFGGFLRLAIGLVVLLILLGVLRNVVNNPDGAPWVDVSTGLGIAVAVIGAFAVLALFLAVIFGLVLPALAGKGGDWMNPDRWSAFEATKDLKGRYARGEVSREEYLAVLADLERPAPPTAREAAPPPP
jgi:uncharacterized membrane protein